MASIGKLAASLITGTQETTLALASINFDFALFKMEAPVEYQGLGNALSSKRKHDAENGSTHVTARKLGALFEDELPEVPHLIQAYGRRVTEIAEMPNVNPKGSSRDGPFRDHVGADGTTIWAAATSGTSAIAMHLLACILACQWPQAEAIAIWVELVIRRRAILQEHCNNLTFKVSELQASRIQISTEQLAEWDGSAR